MTMDKLFDGSDAHLLPGNAELIARLLAKPNRPTMDMHLGNGQTVESMGLGYNSEDDALRKEAADALEAADKRIAELEAEVKHYMNSFELAYNQAMKNGQAAGEAECKLDVAGEALGRILCSGYHDEAFSIATVALAQIGGDDAGS